jgi:hypothetical protein
MNKKDMIERLIKDDIQVIKDALKDNNTEYLEFILRDGLGFNKMSDQGLIEEFNCRTWEIN